MDLVNSILLYFVAKNVFFLRAFLCWKKDRMTELWRSAGVAGVRMNIYDDFYHFPELSPDGTHREGILLDVGCPNAERLIQMASSSRAFNIRHTWLLLKDATLNTSDINEFLADAAILPDADVVWSSSEALVDLYRVKSGHPLIMNTLDYNENWTRDGFSTLWRELPTAVARRKNLTNVYINAATIISQPEHFKGWSDLSNRQIDTYPKLTYPLLMLCAEDLNFRFNLKQVDLYGEERNGSFDGLAGLLQRNQIEVGITSMFMRADRSRVLHFTSETVSINGAFMFRQPSQSAVTNMFLLPFSRGVWAASAVVLVASVALLALFSRALRPLRVDPTLRALTPGETVTFAFGTICQQGFHITPNLMSLRVVMFFTLLTSLFTFTSYSAKIVAILQTPSNSIRTIRDLTRSPMSLGVQETTYKRVYFAVSSDSSLSTIIYVYFWTVTLLQESTEPDTRELYRLKLLPLGERAYLSVVDGIARVRTGLFAFQVEESSGYEIVSKTYTEREKCDLKQIQAFKLPVVAVPIRKHSGYKELFASRIRWQRESGLMDRHRRIWMSPRPRCDAASGGFVSVRLSDVAPALHALVAGAALAALLALAEILLHLYSLKLRK